MKYHIFLKIIKPLKINQEHTPNVKFKLLDPLLYPYNQRAEEAEAVDPNEIEKTP